MGPKLITWRSGNWSFFAADHVVTLFVPEMDPASQLSDPERKSRVRKGAATEMPAQYFHSFGPHAFNWELAK